MKNYGVPALLALGLAACAPVEGAKPDATKAVAVGVQMEAATQAKMGVEVAVLQSSDAPQIVSGFARVMDAGALAAIDAEVSSAQGAAAASDAEYKRLSTLAAADQAASQRAVEAARAQAIADSSRASLALRRISLEWGPALADLSATARTKLLNDVAAGHAALLRVDAPNLTGAPKGLKLRTSPDAPLLNAVILGTAAATDQRLQTAGLLAVVRGKDANGLSAGRSLQAELTLGQTEPGYFVPSSALIRANNRLWVYVRAADGSFQKRALEGARPVAGGWFAPSGFSDGEMIVVEGAASVFAADSGPVAAE